MLDSRSHLVAVAQALFVTFLWSTSWVLIKIGLDEIPAITFAGLRYSFAVVCLLLVAARPGRLAQLRAVSRALWLRLVVLGLLFYAVTQGAQFLGLVYLPAATVTLLLNFTTVVVAILGIPLLAERPTGLQWAGIVVAALGAVVYFYPVVLPRQQLIGLGIVAVGVLANASSAVLGRSINRTGDLSPLLVTLVSMGIGSAVLLVTGVLTQGLPTLSLTSWAIVGWLAVVNTAFAFTLWNHTLRTLAATESSIINNTMLIQVAILAWVFLGERLSGQEIAGLMLAALGTLLVQLRRTRRHRVTDASAARASTDRMPDASAS